MSMHRVIHACIASASNARGPVLTSQATFWNRIARRYAADPIADPAGYEATLARVAGLLQPDQRVLEVGCGTGTTALRLAGGTRRYRATDLSSEMVAIAREKLAARADPALSNTLSFDVADATAPGPDRHDVLLAFNTLHLLPDLAGSLARLLESLQPGGLFISKTACVGEMNPLVPWLALPLARLLGKAPPVRVFKGDALVAALERQGLRIEAVERHGTRGRDIRLFVVASKPL